MLDDALLAGYDERGSMQVNRRKEFKRLCRCCPCDVLPFLMLMCIAFLTFGSYWVFDTPGAIYTQLRGWFGPSYTKADNLALYSIYSWPNTVLAFFGGFIIDRITGVRNGSLLFCVLILAGQVLFSLGVQWKTFWVCLAGRFLFGLGGESLTVAQNTFTVRWFDGKMLALAFGLVVALARVGSSVNFAVTPSLIDSVECEDGWMQNELSCFRVASSASSMDWGAAALACEALPGVPAGSNATLASLTDEDFEFFMDPENELVPSDGAANITGVWLGLYATEDQRWAWLQEGVAVPPANMWLGGEVPTANDTAAVLRLEDLLLQARTATDAGDTLQALCMYTNTVGDVTFSVWFGTLMCVFSLIMCLGAWFIDWFASDRVAAMEAEKERKAVEAGKDPNQKEEAPSILEVRHFPASAWVLFLITLFFYVCVLTFYTVASDIMQNTGKKYDPNTATLFLSIPNFVAIIACPLFGRIVDRCGYALNWILFASVAMVVAHLSFLGLAEEWFSISPVPIMLWLGLCYALGASALWPILSRVVEERMLGTAYGCMTAIQNTGLALFPLVIGSLQSAESIEGTNLEYTLPIIIFISCAVVSSVLTIALMFIDKTGNLNRSGKAKKTQIHADLLDGMDGMDGDYDYEDSDLIDAALHAAIPDDAVDDSLSSSYRRKSLLGM